MLFREKTEEPGEQRKRESEGRKCSRERRSSLPHVDVGSRALDRGSPTHE